jgi:hypothetical protein
MVNELLSLVTRGFDIPHSRLGTQKLLARVTSGFDSPHPSRDPEMINEVLSQVTRGFDSPRESETAVTGDARIRHHTQPP